MIRSIIFDRGGVLLHKTAESIDEQIIERVREQFSRVFKRAKETHKVDLLKGKISVEKLCGTIQEEFKNHFNLIKEWKGAYIETMSMNKEVFQLAKRLKKRYKIALISNVPDLHVKIERRKTSYKRVYACFNPILLSCEVGLMKPEVQIFRQALYSLRSKAEECIFIDDRKEHLITPKRLGFRTVQFKTVSQLIAALKAKGVKL
ncbi:MAG: HAD-IA family hydrolase [Nanoarchaeota archaeon]|mgnify:CR=1 FL=1